MWFLVLVTVLMLKNKNCGTISSSFSILSCQCLQHEQSLHQRKCGFQQCTNDIITAMTGPINLYTGESTSTDIDQISQHIKYDYVSIESIFEHCILS